MTPLLAALLGYLAVQLAVGAWASRRVRSEDDYLVAGRRLGWPVATFSVFATWFGAETCIGAAGRAHREGLSASSAEPFGYALCLVLMGVVYAVPLWRRRLVTFADFFGQRYSPAVERAAAILLVPGSVLWAAAQIRGFGHVLAVTGRLDLSYAVALAAGFCVLYTVFGGLLADATNDMIQGAVLVVGLAAVLVAVVVRIGGPAEAARAFAASTGALAAARGDVPVLEAMEAWAIPVFGSVLATELVARVIASRSPGTARGSVLGGAAMYLVAGSIPVFVGVVGARLVPRVADPEQILAAVAQEVLPAALHLLVAGALVAAILSTVDSTLLAASGLVSHNVAAPLLRIESQRAKVLLARAGVACFGVVAWWLAARAGGVYELVETASAFGSAGVFVVATVGLFTPWGGPRTALATLVAGAAVYVAASASGAETPFLASLAVSAATYAAGAIGGAARRVAARAALLLAVAALPAAAAGAPLVVESRVGDGAWTRTAAVEARVGEPVSLRVRPENGAAVRWYRIAPDLSTNYNNAVWPWEPGAYRWLGFAKIRYARVELERFRGRSEIVFDPRRPEWRALLGLPTREAVPGAQQAAGSYWFQVEVEEAGGILASAGLERNDHRGLSPEILRVTLREGDDLVGHLAGFFNVPGVFGSVPYQVRNFIGVDCADVLMAAHARALGRPIDRDYNVAGLTRELPVVASTVIAEGRTAAPLRWGEDVLRGDLVAVKYAGWGQFGHIGALYRDANGNGVLDAKDLVLHAGPAPLHVSALESGVFDGEVKVLRPARAGRR